jgi:serine/threonine-protein kinase SRPK3
MLCHVHTESGGELPVSSPRYLVSAARTADLPTEYLSDDICVIDFGESYLMASPPEDLGIPEPYLPPEMLLELDELQVESLNSLDKDPAPTDSETSEYQKPFPVGIACDLWALGCTLFEIQKQQALFYMMSNPGEILESTMIFFGPFPESWMERWASRPQRMPKDSDGDSEVTRHTFDKALAYVLDFNGLKQLSLAEQEQKVFRDLLLKLFQYEPEKRAHTEEVLAHEWFRL